MIFSIPFCVKYEGKCRHQRFIISIVLPGCLDSFGNCRTVGERFSQNCDTVECQIVNGSCFHSVTISKGKNVYFSELNDCRVLSYKDMEGNIEN